MVTDSLSNSIHSFWVQFTCQKKLTINKVKDGFYFVFQIFHRYRDNIISANYFGNDNSIVKIWFCDSLLLLFQLLLSCTLLNSLSSSFCFFLNWWKYHCMNRQGNTNPRSLLALSLVLFCYFIYLFWGIALSVRNFAKCVMEGTSAHTEIGPFCPLKFF